MPLKPVNLLCELRTSPIGVDAARPRLSYELEGDGARQAARRLQASLDPGFASTIWDTGRIEDGQTLAIPYEGPAIDGAVQAWWRVKVWDEKGEGPWSEPAFWVASPKWEGSWVATGRSTKGEAAPSLEGASWICHPDDADREGYARREVRLSFHVPAGVVSARLAMSADDEINAWINGEAAFTSHAWQRVLTVSVASLIKEGENELTGRYANFQGVGGLLAVLELEGSFGKIVYATNGDWQFRAEEGGEWKSAHVKGPYGMAPWGRVPAGDPDIQLPAAMFRREFSLPSAPRRAWLFASALGLVTPLVNGQRATEAVLIPGWTEYSKRVHFEGMDVTGLLKAGPNCLAGVLGDGWHSGFVAFLGRRRNYDRENHLRMTLVAEMADGSRTVVSTDGTWKWAAGEVRENDLLMGTRIDRRMALPGWDMPGFDDSGWASAHPAEVGISLEAHPAGSPRRQRVEKGSITISEPGRVQIDFKRNIVGWVRFKVKGAPGQEIVVRHAEMLDSGGLYTVNLRSARATDVHVLSVSETTECEPEFTFHGFRYAEITSDQPFELTEAPEAVVVHTTMPLAYEFHSGNELLDGLIRNSRTSLEGNGVDLFTDCPQRDERAGWTGDAQVYARTGHYLGRVGAITEKYMVDLLQDSQAPEGTLADVAPSLKAVGTGNAGWEDAGIIIPWQQWQMTGETAHILRHWDQMVKFNDSLNARQDSHGLRPVGSYGDWLLLAGLQRSQLLATLYSSLCALRLAEMAEAVGKDGSAFREEAGHRRDYVLRSFQRPDGRLIENDQESQSFYALFIHHPLTTMHEEIHSAGSHLVRLLKERDMKVATGFLGTPHLLGALEKAGFLDEAYQVLLNEDFPGWLYQVKIGATSMWERWDSWHPERGFQDAGMNSFNHFWIGCVAEWMMEGPGGIRPAAPGFAQVEFAPQFTRRLPFVKAACHTVRGRVACSWEWTGDSLKVGLAVPPGVAGRLALPAGFAAGAGLQGVLSAGAHEGSVHPA